MFWRKNAETRTSIKKQEVTCRSFRIIALPNHAKTRKKAKMRLATCRRHHCCKGTPLYRWSSKTRKNPEKAEVTCFRLSAEGRKRRKTTRNRRIFLHFTCIQLQKHTISCRPKGRSAPLACCLPHAAGRDAKLVHRGGEVKSWQSMKSCKELGSWQPRSGRKPLYFSGALWHPSPEQSEGR